MASTAKNDGNQLFKIGRYADAQRRYSEGIECAGPGVNKFLLAQLYLNRSAARLNLNQLTEAKCDAQQAAELAPQWAKPHLRLAESFHAGREYVKAAAELETALEIASDSQDDELAMEIRDRLPAYRRLKDAEEREKSHGQAKNVTGWKEGPFRSGELLAELRTLDLGGSPSGLLDHRVLLGHQALRDGRYRDAARDFLTAAANGNTEGMYNYAVLLERGKGVAQDGKESVRWLEKAAAMPVDEDEGEVPGVKNRGIGEALSALARHYYLGTHFHKNEAKAVALWRRAATLGSAAAMNALGVLHSTRPTAGVSADLPQARDYLRQSAEKFCNEAMLNLAVLHASLQEFDTAARWAESAHKFGCQPAAEAAQHYRELGDLATQKQGFHSAITRCMDEMGSIRSMSPLSLQRDNATPTIEELGAIKTPYGERLRQAKEYIMKASALAEAGAIGLATRFAVQAHQVSDSCLVFSEDESLTSLTLVSMQLSMGVPLDADLALLLKPLDPAETVEFWRSLHQRFPTDHRLAVQAACAMMFETLPGCNKQAAVKLFDEAFQLLPNPSDDSDPETMNLLYLAGSSHRQLGHTDKAKALLSRFLVHAVKDGHRKAPEAHFMLGLIELSNKNTELEKMRAAASHLRHGMTLGRLLPPFLQQKEASPHQRALLTLLQTWSSVKNEPLDIPVMDQGTAATTTDRDQHPVSTAMRHGGELLSSGRRRHDKLCRDSSSLTMQWKTERVAKMMAQSSPRGRARFAASMTPPKKSTGGPARRTLSHATIDELFAALADRVYKGRSLECIVVALPVFTGSSHCLIVEDSQREPAKLAVYNASKTLVEALVPGQVLCIQDPYVHVAQDSSIMLRVDDPANKLQIGEVRAICWSCSVGGDAITLRNCAKCHRAQYCSRECQKRDWKEFGHRFMCV